MLKRKNVRKNTVPATPPASIPPVLSWRKKAVHNESWRTARSHPRRKRSETKCKVHTCKKMALVGKVLCAMHTDARDKAPAPETLTYTVGGAL
jgi:hypothetical protein